MSTWNITSKKSNYRASYTGENFTSEVNYTKDATTDTLQNVGGEIYKANQVFAGNFNGYKDGGVIKYNFEGVALADMANVASMLVEIEGYINNEDNE